MANSWFQFKKFKVEQDKTAMKVGTDGVLLGAWANVAGCHRMLDVGTGTGLIALMLAQRNDETSVTAIDIDEGAVEQAKGNVSLSAWSDRIEVLKANFSDYKTLNGQSFDHIISNPPYFKRSLKPEKHTRTLARHDDSLTHELLLERSMQLLAEAGKLSVILPYVEGSVFIALAATKGLYCTRKTNVYPTPEGEVKRLLLEFSKQKGPLEEDNLVIEDRGRHGYSKEYLTLTADFYLFA